MTQFWDPRQKDEIRAYTHHYDYISDFTYFDDKRQLITTSGDGHLSAIDIRSNKATPAATSEDQEDELLSIAQIKGGQKVIVGSTLGMLSVWNRQMGWGDCELSAINWADQASIVSPDILPLSTPSSRSRPTSSPRARKTA